MAIQGNDVDDATSSPESVREQADIEIPAAPPVLPDVAPSRQDEDEKSKSKEGNLSLSQPGAYEIKTGPERTKLNLAPAVEPPQVERQENDTGPRNNSTTNPRMVQLAPAVHEESPRTVSTNKGAKHRTTPATNPGAVQVKNDYAANIESENQKLDTGPRNNSTTNPRMVQLAPAVHEESPRTVSTSKGAKHRTTPATNPGAVQANNDPAANTESEKQKLALASGAADDPAMEERPGAYSETRDSTTDKIRLAPAIDTKTSTSEEKGTIVRLDPATNPGAYEVQEGYSEVVKNDKTEKSKKLNLAPAVPPSNDQQPTTARDASRLRLAPAVDPEFSPPATPSQSISVDPAEDPPEDPDQDRSAAPSTDRSVNPSSSPSLDPSSSQPEQQDGESGSLLQAEVAPDVQQLVADAVRQAMTNTIQQDQSSRQNLVGEQSSIALAEELSDEEQPKEVVDEEEQSVQAGEKDENAEEKEDKICGMPKLFVLVALVACVIAIIIAVVSTSGGDEAVAPTLAPSFSSESPSLPPSSMPSLLPSSSPTSAQLLIYGAALLPDTNIYSMDQESAQFRALEWIALEDGLGLDLASSELTERFNLAVFHLSTNGQNWIRKKDWMTSITHCQWEFVTCFNGKVAVLILLENNLVGTLPTELFALTNIFQLMLNDNEGLRGTIPKEIGKLTAMQNLSMQKNELTGTIPREIGQLSKANLLTVSDNELTGAIPTEIANMTGLKVLDLSLNPLLTQIPLELARLNGLIILSLSFCFLQGSIPTEFGRLTRLATLFMFGNRLEGPIPSEIGNLTRLQAVELADNILSGSIPTEIGKLTALTNLRIRENFFSGPIPSEIGNLTSLTWLDMHNARLVGAIPSEIGRLTGLTQLNLAFNELRGVVPSELNQLPNANTVELYGNDLTGGLDTTFCNQTMEFFSADCLLPTPKVVCRCCTHCCDSENGECFLEGDDI